MATANAEHAARGGRFAPGLGPPLPRARLAVWEWCLGEEKEQAKALLLPGNPKKGSAATMRDDPEIEQLRARTNCAALLEHLPPPWRLDRKESTRNCLKYRREKGEILIVNHEGRGWWDPQSDAKGDVFDLVQHLDPGLNFGEVRKVLRRFTGLSPISPSIDVDKSRSRCKSRPDYPLPERWARRPLLRQGSPAWSYLEHIRALPPAILRMTRDADVVRDGPYGSAWFAHRDDDNAVTHIEIRGPTFRGSVRGGDKTLFRLHGVGAPLTRFVLAEAPIDALSLAALEDIRPDTLYAATGGGMGPKTIAAINVILEAMSKTPGAIFCSATDANEAGERYAEKHRAFADAAGVAFERLRPPIEDGDWNDILKHRERTKQ